MSLGKCEGYRHACGDPATWEIDATEGRDAWRACDRCAIDALVDMGELEPGAETLPRRAS